jgi:hypothetical protein
MSSLYLLRPDVKTPVRCAMLVCRFYDLAAGTARRIVTTECGDPGCSGYFRRPRDLRSTGDASGDLVLLENFR